MQSMPIPPAEHSAQQSQAKRLQERKAAASLTTQVCGIDFTVNRGVYDTSVDTELMIDTVMLNPSDTFMEVGCGSGAVSILLAQRCAGGLATDINPLATENAKENAARLHVSNVEFLTGNVFAGTDRKFNVLICNPPYNNHPTGDSIERMFWDPDDEVKKTFFREAKEHLLPNGRIYFGWANFKDIDTDLPLKFAAQNGLELKRTAERPSHSGKYMFYVLEFGKMPASKGA